MTNDKAKARKITVFPDSTSFDQKTAIQFFHSLGHADSVFVRAFAPKHAPLTHQLERGMAYRKGEKILKLSPMAQLELTGKLHYQNGKYKGKSTPRGWQQLIDWNRQGYGIYFVVNPGGQDDSQITQAHSLFYEIDDLAKEEQWDRLQELELTIGHALTVVETFNSLHCYAPLSAPITDLALWQHLQKRLIQRQQSDPSIHTLSRVMRVPGFQYWKWDKQGQNLTSPCWVTLEQAADQAISLDEISGHLPQLPEPEQQPLPRHTPKPAGDDYYYLPSFAHLMNDFSPNGRKGWATMQCPHQGDGHSSNPSGDSLHVDMASGGYSCKAGCDSKAVMHAAVALAVSRGYPTFEQWAIQKGIFSAKEAEPMLDPADISNPPPDDGSVPPEAPPDNLIDLDEYRQQLYEKPPEGRASVSLKGTDGEDADQKNSAIRKLELSTFGKMLTNSFCYVATEDAFYDVKTGELLSKAQLQNMWNHQKLLEAGNWIDINSKPYKVTADKLLQAHGRIAYRKTFLPGSDRFVRQGDGHSSSTPYPDLNNWSPYPTGIPSTAQDVKPWLDLWIALYGRSTLKVILWFLAHTLRKPEIKILWAPLVHSASHQMGKETFFKPVFKAMGRDAFKINHMSVSTGFNGWALHKKLILFNEVSPRKGYENYPEAHEFLKEFLGGSVDPDRRIAYNGKYKQVVESQDFSNFILVTNHRHAIRITENNRRYFPVTTVVEDTQALKEKLYAWYNHNNGEGFQRVIGYLQTIPLDTFSPYDCPLEHSHIDEFIEGSKNPIEEALSDFLDELVKNDELVTTDKAILNYLQEQGHRLSKGDLNEYLNNLRWQLGQRQVDGKDMRVGGKSNRGIVVYPYRGTIPNAPTTTEEARELYKAVH